MIVLLAAALLPALVENAQEVDVTALLDGAREAQNKKNWEESLKLYNQVLAQKPGMGEVLLERARLLSWMKRYPESILDYRRHGQLYPEKKVESEKGLAQVLAWSKQFKAAITLLEPYAQQGERQAILDQARYKSWDRQLAASLKQTEEYLKSHPDDEEFLAQRGRVLGWMGEHGKARADFRRVLGKQPQNKEALLGLAQLEVWQGNPEGAEAYLRQMSAEDSKNGDAAILRTRIDQQCGELRKARHDLLPWLNEAEYADEAEVRYWELVAAQGPYVEFSHARTDTNEGLRQDTDNVEVGLPFFNGQLKLGGNWLFLKVNPADGVKARQTYASISHPLGKRLNAGAAVYHLDKGKTDYDLNVNYRAAKGVNLGLGYSHMTNLATPFALELKTVINNWTLRGNWTFGEGLNIVNASLESGKVKVDQAKLIESDLPEGRDSTRTAYNASYVRRLVFHENEVRLGAVARGQRYNPGDQVLGFFNPRKLDFLGFNGGFSIRREQVFDLSLDGQAGTQKIKDLASKFAWSYNATLSATPFGPGLVLFGSYGQCSVATSALKVDDLSHYKEHSYKLGARLIFPRWIW